MNMKTCTKCLETKPDEAFSVVRDKRCRHGHTRLKSECKVCASAKTKAWYEKNKDRALAQQAAWRDANRDQWNARMNAAGKKRYCSKMQRVPCWADEAKTKEVYRRAGEYRTLGIDVDVDHIVPLQGRLASGLHVHWNLRIVLAADNRGKKNQVDFDAYRIPSEL